MVAEPLLVDLAERCKHEVADTGGPGLFGWWMTALGYGPSDTVLSIATAMVRFPFGTTNMC